MGETNIIAKHAFNDFIDPQTTKIVKEDEGVIELHQHGGLSKPEYYLGCILRGLGEEALKIDEPTEAANKLSNLALECHRVMASKLVAIQKQKAESNGP